MRTSIFMLIVFSLLFDSYLRWWKLWGWFEKSHTLWAARLAEVVSYSAGTLLLSNCALKFKYVIVKSLMIEDKRVGEEAKVECGVLFIRHLRSRITIRIWYCLFGHSLNNRLRVNIPSCHASLKKKVASSRKCKWKCWGSSPVSVS